MSFESGSITCRAFYLLKALEKDVIDDFARDAAPGINTLRTEPISGWVTGRHLLDRNIDEDSATVAGRLRLTLMKAERKIPPALLRAECKIEELALMQAEGWSYVKRQKRAEIKGEVMKRLLPQMPPTLLGIDMVYSGREQILYAAATSDKQVDAFTLAFQSTTGQRPIPMTAETSAAQMKRIDPADFAPTSYSPELEDKLVGCSLGQDFLTWLWFYSEARGSVMTIEGTAYGVAVEGPLTFFMEGNGAHVSVLRQGVPELSAEAKTCLLSGKKLRSARITIASELEQWSCNLDADAFLFRGLKIPKGEELDPISKFDERMLSLDRFRNTFQAFYLRFLEERTGPDWKSVQKDIHAWVSGRASKK